MQLKWLYFCGICHMMPLKVRVAEHSSRLQPSINLHPPVTAFMFSCSGTQCTPGGWRLGSALCSDRSLIVYWPPLRIRTRAAGFKIISGDHYTTTAHTTLPLHWNFEIISYYYYCALGLLFESKICNNNNNNQLFQNSIIGHECHALKYYLNKSYW